MQQTMTRVLPVGAQVFPDGVHFRVWAPHSQLVRVVLEEDCAGAVELNREPLGYFSGIAFRATAGSKYRFQLGDNARLWPDPSSRFQPDGPEGPSQVVDPSAFAWHDHGWPGVRLEGQVIYEMHIGTFTSEGSWAAATKKLPHLVALGVTILEVMPIGEFPGRFGWGYDVANLFAPTRLFGIPDDVRMFVDEAHQLGLGVILDVVYNHLGRVGEQLLRPFSETYFSRRYTNDWGTAINFDETGSESVREFFAANVAHWIAEYHFDGLRIDATQAFHDQSAQPILLELSKAARRAAPDRRVLVVGESEPQDAQLLRPENEAGCEIDALWSDDFHHAAMVCLTGHNEAYYSDYQGTAEELLAAVKWGFLYQGQRYSWQKKSRGKPALDLKAAHFIHYLQNHDQIANSASGKRIHELTSPGRFRAMTALLLLAPPTPLLFQGQEFSAASPFLYFNDINGEEACDVARGRAKFLSQFPSLAVDEMQRRLPTPSDPESFRRSKLDWSQLESHSESVSMHQDLLRLRRDDPVLREHDAGIMHGATLGPDAALLRFLPASGETRLLIFNFGRSLTLPFISQPLIAPPGGHRWALLWSSEDPLYGGSGTPELDTSDGWRIPGESTVVLVPLLELAT